jgi:hypothetical protein
VVLNLLRVLAARSKEGDFGAGTVLRIILLTEGK